MKKIGKIFKQRVLTSMLILIVVSLLIGSVVEHVHAADSKNAGDQKYAADPPMPSIFAHEPPAPGTSLPSGAPVIGLAADEYHLYATTWCDPSRSVWDYNDNSGVPKHLVDIWPFSTDPRGTGCFEDYIAISPGDHGWPPNHLYVTEGRNITDIDLSAQPITATLFRTLPATMSASGGVGITFDRTGITLPMI